MRPVRLGLLTAAPVHYHVPAYRILEQDPRVDFTVIYCSDVGVRAADVGFGGDVAWGGDLLSGYKSVFLKRASRNPIVGGFFTLHDFDVAPLVARERFDVLWSHGYNHLSHQIAVAAQRARRGGLLLREEQTLIHPRGVAKTMVKEVALRGLLRSAFGLYIGSESKRWFQHYGVPDERLFFSPYSVDNLALREKAEELGGDKEEIRRSFGIADDAGPVILFAARLIPKKQPQKVLEAFSRIRADRRCALLVVGDGELHGELSETVRRESIPDVSFAGFLDQTEIWKAYACSDVFTLFSAEHETWGIVVNEAMNFSLPMVVSDKVGCARDLVSEGRNGFVVPSEDVEMLARRLAVLIDSPELRARFGGESRAIVEEWTPERSAAGVISAALAASR
jgi:glycosyltransferase involved in cell wall biosynthesis